MTAQAHEPLIGPCAWTGTDVVAGRRWTFTLGGKELEEIDTALAAACDSPWHDMTAADFPLPGLSETLGRIAAELEHGSGLAKLTGLPVERFTQAGLRRLWYGLGLALGTPVYQDCNGLLMRDITDKAEDTDARLGHRLTARDGSTFKSSKARTLSNKELRFHTDRCDVVGLLCVRQAARGGVSRLASSVAVHNLMLARRPDLLEALYQPVPRSRLGEERGGEAMIYELPVMGHRDGKFTSHYSRTYIEAADETGGGSRITEAQWQAIDLLHEIAEEISFEMILEPGDIQFVNNHVVYHARTAYEDTGKPGQERLLHRLWLAMPNSRPLPPDHAVLWGNTDAGALRGGIGQG